MQRRRNMKDMNSNVLYVLISIFSIASILLVTEIVLNVYKFNHQQQKRTKKESRNAFDEDDGYEIWVDIYKLSIKIIDHMSNIQP